MNRTIERTMINRPGTARRTLWLATKLTLVMLCSLLIMMSTALAQELRPAGPRPDAQPQSDERTAAEKESPPPANGLLEVINPAPQQPNLAVTDGEIVFDSPGVATYARDIRLSDNLGGLRFYGASSLTTSPVGAAIQFFGNATSFPRQLYLKRARN